MSILHLLKQRIKSSTKIQSFSPLDMRNITIFIWQTTKPSRQDPRNTGFLSGLSTTFRSESTFTDERSSSKVVHCFLHWTDAWEKVIMARCSSFAVFITLQNLFVLNRILEFLSLIVCWHICIQITYCGIFYVFFLNVV